MVFVGILPLPFDLDKERMCRNTCQAYHRRGKLRCDAVPKDTKLQWSLPFVVLFLKPALPQRSSSHLSKTGPDKIHTRGSGQRKPSPAKRQKQFSVGEAQTLNDKRALTTIHGCVDKNNVTPIECLTNWTEMSTTEDFAETSQKFQ